MFPMFHSVLNAGSPSIKVGEVIFHDTFTTGAFVELQAHTPTNAGTSWIQDGGVNTYIYGNDYLRTYMSGGYRAARISDAVPDERTVKMILDGAISSIIVGAVTRHSGTNNQIAAFLDNTGKYTINQTIAGVTTQLAIVSTGVPAVPDVDVFEFTDDNSTISIYRNGELQLSHTTSQFSDSPAAGVLCGPNYGYITEFAVTSGIDVTGFMPA